MDAIDKVTLALIEHEANRAQQRYGDFTSTHEGLGVLVEEMRELEEAIRANDMIEISREAQQIAAVAARLCDHAQRALGSQLPAFLERSGCE